MAGDPGAGATVLVADAGVQDFVAEGDLSGEVLRRTVRHVLERRRLREELDRHTFVDELTGPYNANGFEQIARHHLRLADRTEEPLALVFVRIDELAAVGRATERPRILGCSRTPPGSCAARSASPTSWPGSGPMRSVPCSPATHGCRETGAGPDGRGGGHTQTPAAGDPTRSPSRSAPCGTTPSTR